MDEWHFYELRALKIGVVVEKIVFYDIIYVEIFQPKLSFLKITDLYSQLFVACLLQNEA